MGQALYRKYRSKGWDEVVGQPHVTKTLANAAKQGKFGHAYLFSGPRGVGKTSVARILAHQINGLGYTSDEPHIDIIEIDAASNTSVDDIRDLREKIAVAPALAKYKVYIIDEVHMLSKSAANALLKTLEEPPAHVVFILATTDPDKLPATIVSRTQHFAFQPIATELMAKQLEQTAKLEKINLKPDAAALIAELGEGSFRDALSLLDQLAAGGQAITVEAVESLVGLPPERLISDLAQAVERHEPRKVAELLGNARISDYQAGAIAKRLSQLWLSQTIESASADKLGLLKQLLGVGDSFKPDQLLELILLEAALSGTPKGDNESTSPSKKPAAGSKPSAPESSAKPTKPAQPKPTDTLSSHDELWAGVLEHIRPLSHTLYAMARMAKATLTGDTLTLELSYPFHVQRLSDAKNQKLIGDAASMLAGRPLTIDCRLNPDIADDESALTVSDPAVTNPPFEMQADPTEVPGDIKAISNIFGGAELLQS